HMPVGEWEIHALGAGRRHDMGGAAGEKEPAMLHRLDHEAAHGRDALLDDAPLGEVSGSGEPTVKLLPDPVVRPTRHIIVGRTLKLEVGKRPRAHRVERRATVDLGLDYR